MNIKHNASVLIPSVFSWLLASLLLLIYSFDILEFVNSLPANPFAGLGAILLGFILILVVLVLYLTGTFLDKNPEKLKLFILIGMVGSSVMTILFIVFIDEPLLMVLFLAGLAFFFGILLTSSGTVFAGLIDTSNRARSYSRVIGVFILIAMSSVLFGGLFSSRFRDDPLLSKSFVSMLPLTGLVGLILSLVFFLLTRDLPTWQNDEWPTGFKKIISRRSVRAYVLTHFLLYCMLGLSIASFFQAGQGLGVDYSWLLTIPGLGDFNLPVDKVFWFTVLIGDLLIVLPAGYIADRYGRKNLIVLAIYGILLSSLFFGLEKSPNSFFLSALVLGFSFALLHPTLDSSLWADLSPRDGLARYYSFGFISLAAGLGAGYAVGWWLIPSITRIEIVPYVLVVLAVFAALPLFWVSDSYKPLDFPMLLVINNAGLPVFHYTFEKELIFAVDLPLLSGALRAISTFMAETIKEKGELNLVQHGHNFIITEKKDGISAALFCNKQDPELQAALREFLTNFSLEFGERVKYWDGSSDAFDEAVDIAEKVFGHLASSSNLEE
ncbi:MAG: MFS transporter [Candidatus Odinarchaeota archaeon]